MVSIMPGMEARAPERMETSRGFFGVAESLADGLFQLLEVLFDFLPDGVGDPLPALIERSQTSVETVKPGGTGRPIPAISARLAPLPPRRFFISLLPSAVPAPKKYTYFFAIGCLLTNKWL